MGSDDVDRGGEGSLIVKNIILLITDTFRYDNLFDRADRPVRTPELDRFAQSRATEVGRMYTSYPA